MPNDSGRKESKPAIPEVGPCETCGHEPDEHAILTTAICLVPGCNWAALHGLPGPPEGCPCGDPDSGPCDVCAGYRKSPLPVRDCKPCRGEGWLHYSTGAPMDVCEECHGTGCTSAYAAYNLIERLTNGK